MKQKDIVKLIVSAAVLFVVAFLIVVLVTGCATSVNTLLLQQASDYNETVVRGVLLPHYVADPAVPPESRINMEAAVAEHADFLRLAGEDAR